MGPRRGGDGRLRVPGQDGPGVPGAARVRPGVPRRGAHQPAPPALAAGRRARAPWSLAGGWWVAIVELWPTGSRPYIDGTSANSVLDLVVGYNGLGRIFGASGPGGGGGGGAGFSGSTGVLRLFNNLMGGQASWLLPAALIALVLRPVAHAPRTAHRPYARGADAVGRLAARHGGGVQLLERRHPHLLHGRPGARDRGPRRDRRMDGLAGAPQRVRPRGGCRDRARHLGVVVGAA